MQTPDVCLADLGDNLRSQHTLRQARPDWPSTRRQCSRPKRQPEPTDQPPERLGVVLSGRELRVVATVVVLGAHRDLSIAEIISRIEARGVSIKGRASKAVSDALRWEVAKGRLTAPAWGTYAPTRVPRSTQRWLQLHADAAIAGLPWPQPTNRERSSTPAPIPYAPEDACDPDDTDDTDATVGAHGTDETTVAARNDPPAPASGAVPWHVDPDDLAALKAWTASWRTRAPAEQAPISAHAPIGHPRRRQPASPIGSRS